MNKVILCGHLGRDPESKQAGGTTIANLRIATPDRRKDKSGQWVDAPEWHTVTCFGRTAENVSRYCRKGSQVLVEGRLQTRKWQDKDGRDRWSTEIVADSIRFVGGTRDGDARGGDHDGGGSTGGGYGGDAGGYGGASDDDIPF